MASSFRIVMHETSENLYLRLIGDFDGSSAFELLEVLKDRADAVQKVFIHTSGLGEVHPFGQGVFEKRASELREELQKFHFTENRKGITLQDGSVTPIMLCCWRIGNEMIFVKNAGERSGGTTRKNQQPTVD